MECKYCKAQLEEDVSVCPVCGRALCEGEMPESQETASEPAPEVTEEEIPEQIPAEAETVAETEDTAAETTEETEKVPEETAEEPAEPVSGKKAVWKTIGLIAGCVAALAIVTGAVLYGLGIDLRPRENNVLYKDSYTVAVEKGGKAADKVVATVGDQTLTNAELQIYYWNGVRTFFNYYGSYLAMAGLDQSKPLEDQVFDSQTGQTWQQYLLDTALNSWHRYACMNLMAQEDGFQLDASAQTVIDSASEQLEQMAGLYGFDSALDMLQEDFGTVCNLDGYMRYLQSNTVGLAYYNGEYEKLEPTDDEVTAYFAEKAADFEAQGVTKDSGKYVDVRHILICPEGGTVGDDGTVTYSEEEWETCRASAQAMLDQWLAGDATEESFSELAVQNSADGGSASNGGLYTQVYEGQMVEPFENWCFDESRQYGDTGLVQTNYGYHVMYFVDSYDIWYFNAKSELISQTTEQMLQNAMERWPMEVNYKNIALSDLYSTSGQTGETTAPTETTAE